jgi:hypothetical protein
VTQGQELAVWGFCVVVASVLPILAALGQGSVQAGSPGLMGILSSGNLYLVGVVLTIGGVGDLGVSLINRTDTRAKLTALFVLIPGVILAIFEGIFYAQVTTHLLTDKTVAHVGQVALLSFVAFLASSALSGIGVYMAAGD